MSPLVPYLKDLDSFVLTPCFLLFVFNLVLTVAARAAVDEEHWAKRAPW